MATKKAIIIGAGPAGLTAALELLRLSDIQPVILESSEFIGGISRTANYKGNLMDLGGHRFFSKSDKVLKWWSEILPIEKTGEDYLKIFYRNQSIVIDSIITTDTAEEKVMLVRNRKSRIFYNKKFFPYPLSFSLETFRQLGFFNSLEIFISYLKSTCFPLKKETNLEEFYINRFGEKLYKTFFKDYTEKVWGLPCKDISAEWGKQRIKSLSLAKTITHFIKNKISTKSNKNTETSLIEKFLYPKYGPGQMWETVAEKITAKGGIICKNHLAVEFSLEKNQIKTVKALNTKTNEVITLEADYFISTMPVKELVRGLHEVPLNIRDISEGLQYRDFLIVGLLVTKLKTGKLDDNWIYIQDSDAKVARLQIFNNWSPGLVKDRDKIWIGAEYFTNETDDFWKKSDHEILDFCKKEMETLGFLSSDDVIDGTVIRVKKAYPAYFGTYFEFEKLKTYLNHFENLFLIGRNGMHKYNNQDHSMLTAMKAVELIINNSNEKSAIWEINTEEEYHEEKKA